MSPLVSIIVPAHNGEKYLSEAIESILAQAYCPIEIILVDDGSTDGTSEIARRFFPSVRYYYQTNGGTGAARNRGVQLAQGSFFAFLDADDLWLQDKLTIQMAVFENNPDLDIVFGQVKQFFSPELDENQRKRRRIPAGVMPRIFKSSMLIKRDSFFRVGTFDTRWKVGDFVCWYLRAVEDGLKSEVLDEIVVLRRIHMNNMSIRECKSQTDFVRMLKASLDKKRSAVGEDSVK